MGSKVVYSAKAFGKDRRGEFVTTKTTTCKTAAEAMQTAERLSIGRGAAGAAAFQGQNDDDFGMTDEPIVLAAFGDLPAGLRDALPF